VTVASAIVSQFGNPRGPLGAVAGWIMANRPSNRARNAWLVEQAAIGPADRVLELGCGPGFALGLCLARARQGHVTGLDQSAVMLRQAARRNRQALAAGRLDLKHLTMAEISSLEGRYDRVISANILQFLSGPQRSALLVDLRPLLSDNVRLATCFLPRKRNATAEDARRFAADHAEELSRAGYASITTQWLDLRPVPAVCIIAHALRSAAD